MYINKKHHIIFWLIWITYACLITYITDKSHFAIWSIILANVLVSGIFYSIYFICYAYKFLHKNKISIILYFITVLVVYAILRYIHVFILLEIFSPALTMEFTWPTFIGRLFLPFIQFSLWGLGVFYASFGRQSELNLKNIQLQNNIQQNQILSLQKEKLVLQNDLLQSENNFLRAQINPHFLYNCLNFFYSETFQNNPNAAEGILMLSDIMRYSLKDHTATNGLAHLTEEVAHIENVINIHQLRFAGSLQISFTVEGEAEGKLVAPMILITLVENIFKHGDLHDKNNPAQIHCRINAATQIVFFATYNKKKTGASEDSTGIGLSNIKQRLQALYKDDFSITTADEPTSYKKEITIPYFDNHQQKSFAANTVNRAIC